MKRVLITGGSGFLGARILQQGLGDAELCSLPRGFLAAAGEAEVTEAIQKLQPAAIVHAAALSDTGYCAQHPEEAHRANVELPVWVAKAACASGAKLLAFSSDQVYVDDMIAAGIVDPTKVTRSALENAASVAEMVLTTESLVADLPEPPAPAAPAGDMGGMGGMY